MNQEELISIIVITRDREKEVNELVDSILKSDYPDFEIIIFDNGSKNQTKIYSKSKKIKYYYSKDNLMGIGRNRASSLAKGEFLFFLDDDAKISKNSLSVLYNNFNRLENVGILTPSIYSFENNLMYSGRQISLITSVNRRYVSKNKNYKLKGNINNPPYLVGVYGAFAFIRKDLFNKVGGFDEDFVFHYEETELSLKVKKLNKDIYYIGDAITYHPDTKRKDSSKNTFKSKILDNLWNNILFYPDRCFYTSRNRILIMKKFAPKFNFLIFIIFFNSFFVIYHTILLFVSMIVEPATSKYRIKNYYGGLKEGYRLIFSNK